MEHLVTQVEWHVQRKIAPEEVEAILADLGSIRRRDGTVVSLVNKAADGRWSAAGV